MIQTKLFLYETFVPLLKYVSLDVATKQSTFMKTFKYFYLKLFTWIGFRFSFLIFFPNRSITLSGNNFPDQPEEQELKNYLD